MNTTTPTQPRKPHDIHGRKSIPGVSEILTDKQAKAIIRNRTTLAPKPKNGLTDPFTYYHVLDAILDLFPGNLVSTWDIVQQLQDRPILFNVSTVGRVINDMAESLNLVNGQQSIFSIRHWDGISYWTKPTLESRVAMEKLLEDLELLCVQGAEKSIDSPLRRCPSVQMRG